MSMLCTEYDAGRQPMILFPAYVPKGLLSIPCDGRGARRPLGQSFRESVGPPCPLTQSTGQTEYMIVHRLDLNQTILCYLWSYVRTVMESMI
jgi:hypothetical protein